MWVMKIKSSDGCLEVTGPFHVAVVVEVGGENIGFRLSLKMQPISRLSEPLARQGVGNSRVERRLAFSLGRVDISGRIPKL